MCEYLPQELVIGVLQRLPINSVIRCRCVCKSWYSLIASPAFISAHLNRNQDDHILVRRFSGNPIKEKYDLFIDNENFDLYAQFDLPFERHSYHFNVVGSCNGLLCLSDDDEEGFANLIYLWNPSIRKSVKLPKPIFVSVLSSWYRAVIETRRRGPVYHMMGFGFDSVTNDYKVLRIGYSSCDNIGVVSPNVELYKLSTGVWQDLTLVAPFYDFFPRVLAGVYFNGACHWVASKGKGALEIGGKCQHVIVLFDMHDDMFREIMLPASLVEECWFEDFEFILFESQESLCVAHNDCETTIDIWIMKGYSDPESWVKQFSISRSITFSVVADEFFSMLYGGSVPHEHRVTYYLFQPMASRKNGEILWRACRPFLVSYDLAVKKMKCLCIHSTTCEPFHGALYVNTYKESLVLLDKRTDLYGGDTCEESFDLCKKELKGGGRKKFLKGKTKRRFQNVSSLRGLMCMSKMKAKRLTKIKQKKNKHVQVKKLS